jgi:hypothetical protein
MVGKGSGRSVQTVAWLFLVCATGKRCGCDGGRWAHARARERGRLRVHSRKRGQRVRGDSVRVRLRLRLRGSELGAGDSKRELRCSVSRRAAGERAPRQAHTHSTALCICAAPGSAAEKRTEARNSRVGEVSGVTMARRALPGVVERAGRGRIVSVVVRAARPRCTTSAEPCSQLLARRCYYYLGRQDAQLGRPCLFFAYLVANRETGSKKKSDRESNVLVLGTPPHMRRSRLLCSSASGLNTSRLLSPAQPPQPAPHHTARCGTPVDPVLHAGVAEVQQSDPLCSPFAVTMCASCLWPCPPWLERLIFNISIFFYPLSISPLSIPL